MGSLEVTIMRAIPGIGDTESTNVIVRYCSPFLGSTSAKFEGNDSSDFNDVQKSYGFWMIPPDIGATVMVLFVDGDVNQGYWFGCVSDIYQNQMIPGLAASRHSAMTKEERDKYGTDYVPVAEYLKGTRNLKIPTGPDTQNKPVHPFADRLLQQGLLADTIRGVTSSGARREVPSRVFGISTPGPLDTSVNAPRKNIGFNNSQFRAPISRLGGTTFVMDDGDEEGKNELVRIRTRTGHQILLHNSSDLIYIANSKGTAWIELTSNGKIDMYAEDSVSIHTQNDFNFRADRDINMEAGRNINISAIGDWHLDAFGDFVVNVANKAKMTVGSDYDIKVGSTIRQEAAGEMHLKAKTIYEGAANIHVNASGSLYLQAGAKMSSVAATWAVSASGNSNISAGGEHRETAGRIEMNGPSAEAADSATPATTAIEATPLPTFSLPNRSSTAGWANGRWYKAEDIISIMKRVPTHEPWDQHESINPTQFSASATDIGGKEKIQPSKNPSVAYTKVPATAGTPPTPTGNTEEDNIAAFLWMIRVCEGTSGPTGYNTMFTGKLFEGFADHPRQAISASVSGAGLTSTAAGAYQFLSKTWDQCQKTLSLPDFSPASQDKACILLLKQARALDLIKSGDFTAAIKRTNKIWASLPDSPYNQNPKDYNTALAFYKQGGGTALA
jgi:lysozyme